MPRALLWPGPITARRMRRTGWAPTPSCGRLARPDGRRCRSFRFALQCVSSWTPHAGTAASEVAVHVVAAESGLRHACGRL